MKAGCKLGIGAFLLGIGLMTGCNDDDDEFRLSEEQLTRKDWYYNGSRDQWGYSSDDVMEVLNFASNHDVVEKEFAGRQETRRGTWSLDDANNLAITWGESDRENWIVLDCNDSRLQVLGWGEREYVTDAGLQDLTGDAYWVNEFDGTAGSEGFITRLGFVLSGNSNVRDPYVLLSDSEDGRVKLERSGSASEWTGRVERPNESTKVRFSCRIGSGGYMKFDDEVSANNFENVRWSDINPETVLSSNGVNVKWNAVREDGVYYQVLIYEDGNEENTYFVSSLLGTPGLNVTVNTMGVLNRLSEMGTNVSCRARVSVILLESGVDPNDIYASCNLQAILYAVANGNFSNVF